MEDSEEKQEKPTAPGEARNGGKLLSGKQWFATALVILGAVATGVINIGVREYYQPDVRYEEGTWYYAGGSGIMSLRIKNYGAADAENIKFTATFEETIKNASVNDPTIECRFDDRKDETDPKTITGRIERLVPRQAALVYYDIGPIVAGRVFKEGTFVRSMVYDGGQGKTGEPSLLRRPTEMIWLLVFLVGAPAMVIDMYRTRRRMWQLERNSKYGNLRRARRVHGGGGAQGG